MRSLSVIAAAICLAACGRSPPVHYYSLAPIGGTARNYGGAPVRLESVQVPPGLDNAHIARRATPYKIDIAQNERWNEALGYLMRSAVAQDLASRLPEAALVYPDAPKPAGCLGWVVDILSFTEMDGKLSIEASWTLLSNDPPAVAGRHHLSLSEAASGSSESTAEALSKVLGKLADAMADSLSADAATIVRQPGG